MTRAEIEQQINQKLQNLSSEELQRKADSLIDKQNLAKHSSLIELMSQKNTGNPQTFFDSWTPMLWQSNSQSSERKVTVNGQSVPLSDMDYYIAKSLESIQAQQDPEAEYYAWVEQAKTIMHDMKSEGTTLSELKARSDFLNMLDDRETDIKRLISLYSGAAFNNNCAQQAQAQAKLKFLTFKLSELRKIRERLQNVKPSRPSTRQVPPRGLFDRHVSSAYPDYGAPQYEQSPEQEKIDKTLDTSSAAVGIAAGLAAMELLQLEQSTQPDPEIQKIIDSYTTPKETKLQKLLRLRGINRPSHLHRRRGFNSEKYRQLISNIRQRTA